MHFVCGELFLVSDHEFPFVNDGFEAMLSWFCEMVEACAVALLLKEDGEYSHVHAEVYLYARVDAAV